MRLKIEGVEQPILAYAHRASPPTPDRGSRTTDPGQRIPDNGEALETLLAFLLLEQPFED
jgi:hypothetical protein